MSVSLRVIGRLRGGATPFAVQGLRGLLWLHYLPCPLGGACLGSGLAPCGTGALYYGLHVLWGEGQVALGLEDVLLILELQT